jgi:hypothetical protein
MKKILFVCVIQVALLTALIVVAVRLTHHLAIVEGELRELRIEQAKPRAIQLTPLGIPLPVHCE